MPVAQFEKVWILIRMVPIANGIFSSDRQREKHASIMVSTEAGIQIDFSDQHPLNAEVSMGATLDGVSNTTVSSALLIAKQPGCRISTDVGMKNDFSEEQNRNALSSIRASLDGDSNATF
jgi:hypothetical protein